MRDLSRAREFPLAALASPVGDATAWSENESRPHLAELHPSKVEVVIRTRLKAVGNVS
jgi:hypothetical protein